MTQGLTGEQLLIHTIKRVGLYDSVRDDILDDRFYSKADILDEVNLAYQEEVYSALRNVTRLFRQEAVLDNWSDTSEVSATSTGTTLIIEDGIFSNKDIGAYVYNYTTEERVTISSFTNSNEVVVDTDLDMADWIGDTVYLLNGWFPYVTDFGLDRVTNITAFGIKYTTSDDYIMVEHGNYYDINREFYQNDVYFNESTPIIIEKSYVKSNGETVRGVQVLPIPTTPVTNGILIEYNRYPTPLGLTDYPLLPLGHHMVIALCAAANIAQPLGLDQNRIAMIKAEYQIKLDRLLTEYRVKDRFTMIPRVRRKRNSASYLTYRNSYDERE